MKLFALLAIPPVLMLAGCQSAEQRSLNDSVYCSSLAKPETPMYAQCMMNQQQVYEMRRARQSQALMAFGSATMAAGQPPQRTTVNTTCQKQGVFVNCTSW